eukprot:gene7282-7495_t
MDDPAVINLSFSQGYQVEVFRKLAAAVGWHTDDYQFTCTPSHSYMLEDLVDPAGHCSLTATGVLADPVALSAGYMQFTWPTLKGGLRIMIHSKTHSGSMWGFLGGFHWSVWLALYSTTVCVGLLIGFFEHSQAFGRASQSGQWSQQEEG